jgi:hypothetical protein
MEIIEYIAALEIEGARLADTAAAIDLDAPVPTCPGWAASTAGPAATSVTGQPASTVSTIWKPSLAHGRPTQISSTGTGASWRFSSGHFAKRPMTSNARPS